MRTEMGASQAPTDARRGDHFSSRPLEAQPPSLLLPPLPPRHTHDTPAHVLLPPAPVPASVPVPVAAPASVLAAPATASALARPPTPVPGRISSATCASTELAERETAPAAAASISTSTSAPAPAAPLALVAPPAQASAAASTSDTAFAPTTSEMTLRTAKSSSCVLDRCRQAELQAEREHANKRGGGRTRAARHDHNRTGLPPAPTTWPETSSALPRRGRSELALCTHPAVDRRLVQRYEEVNQAIDRLTHVPQASELEGNDEALKQLQRQLNHVRRSSSMMIQNQKDLLEKIERQERSRLRRMFTINHQGKMDKLRNRLCEKLSESAAVDEQLTRLERQSMSLTSMSFATMNGLMEGDELSTLELERDRLVSRLLKSAGSKDIEDLHLRLASYAAEKKACECAMRQVEQVEALYRKALHLLRIALATVVAPNYSGSLKEFFLNAFPPAVEAGQLIQATTRVIQPEARRRYSSFAPELSSVRPPRFPQPILDFAKRSRGDYYATNALSMEASHKLRHAENIVVLMQRLVVQRLELVEKWRLQVEQELKRADTGYRQLDQRLKDRMLVLARSISV